MTTAELDAAAERVFEAHGARSGPRLDYDFPGTICISVDAEAVHGIPGPRALREGELVKLDVTAELDGCYADACVTVPVGAVAPRQRRLIGAAEAGLRRGIAAATAGAPLNAIGAAVERGLLITVEPIIAAGRGDVVAMPDGWTVRTADGSPVAHAEHTIVVTEAEPIVLTTPSG